MAELVEITFLDGTCDIVTLEEAEEYRQNNELLIPSNDGKALTLEEFWGPDYG